jgi:hypothetical protein
MPSCVHPPVIETTDPGLMTLDQIDSRNAELFEWVTTCARHADPSVVDAVNQRRYALLGARREKMADQRKMKWFAAATVPGALIGAYAGHKAQRGALPGAAVGAWANFVIFAAGTSLLMRILPARY